MRGNSHARFLGEGESGNSSSLPDVRHEVVQRMVTVIVTCFSMNSTLGAHVGLATVLCGAALTMCQAEMPRRSREVLIKYWQHQLVMALGFPTRLTHVNIR